MPRKTKKRSSRKRHGRTFWRKLSDNELQLIDHLRDTGQVPSNYTLKSDVNLHKLKTHSSDIKKKYKALLQEHEHLQRRVSIYENMKAQDKKPYTIVPRQSSRTAEATACLIASDWHLEERIDPSTVDFLNEYNIDVAKQRIRTFFKNGLSLIELMRAGTRIDTIVLALLGDVITGYIHEELMEDNYLSPTQAILEARELIIEGIDFLLREGKFKHMIIPCAFGNHGRTTLRKKFSTSYKNSFEWMMYHGLRDVFRDNRRVEFIISNGPHTWVNLYNKYDIRFHHGDAISYQGGVGGITIPVNKAIAKWNTIKKAYLDVFGHFHQFIDGGNFLCNGSVIGYSTYATMIKASYEQPRQAFFLVDRDRGKTIVAPVWVEET